MENNQVVNIDSIDSVKVENLLNKVIEDTLSPYIDQIRETGLKKQIEIRAPGLDINRKLISIAEKHLSPVRNIELGKGIGRVSICYRNGKIIIKPAGTFALFINEITITDAQIIAAFDNVLDQIQRKYIDDLSFIKIRIAEIIKNLSETGLYKPSISEEKTLYDLILLILLNYDFKREESLPEWIKIALDNLEKEEITNSLLLTIKDHVSMIATVISENLYIDLKRAIDSRILRVTLSKKTNKGQISGFLNLIGIDIKSKIEEFAKEYMSPSFVQGVGEIIVNIASSILYDIQENDSGISEDIDERVFPFDVTVTMGRDPKTQRAFRWYTSKNIKKNYIYVSESKDFSDFIKFEAEYEDVLNPKTVYDLGPLSKYTVVEVSKFSCVVCNLKPDTRYYYRVGDTNTGNISDIMSFKMGKNSKSFTFISLADSQGMVKSNYDLFNNTFKAAVKKFPEAEFVAHLGDFVDDGNNEDYWEWLFEDKVWQQNAVVPVAGNHEARVNHVVYESGAENSIISHFNVQGYPEQDTSTGIYYSFEYGDATFIVFNTNDLDKDNKIDMKQYKWALRVANNVKTKWRIVLIHKSPYSNGPHHDDDDVKAMTKQIVDFCREAKIDFVIAGHDHVFVRTPVLINGKKSRYNDKIIKRNGIKYETAINPPGTMFVVPGTSGAKNYGQDVSAIIPNDVMEQPNCPIFSAVTVEDNILYFSSYKYDDVKGKSYLLDSYALEKTNVDYINAQKEDDEEEEIRLKNAYKNIKNSSKVVVRNRFEFIQALDDESVGTIITEGNDIKIETIFGRKRNQVIERDICIRGSSCIYNITFKVRNGAALIFKDLVTVDNTRTQGSLFPAANCVELYDDSVLVMEDFSSLRTEYGTGLKGFCLFMYGEKSRAYFNSDSEQWGSKGSIYAVCEGSKIVINSGKFSNKGIRNSVKTCGKIVINGGKIKDLQAMHGSKVFLNDGIIGNDGNLRSKVPVTIYNKAYFSGGRIRENNGISINLADKNARLYIRPSHEGAVDICGMKPYLSRIKTDNFRDAVSVFNDDIRGPRFQKYDKMFITHKKIHKFDELVELTPKELDTSLDNGIKASLPKGDSYVWARALYVSADKDVDHFKCSYGAKAFIYSDLKHITNYPVEKIYINKVGILKFSENDENKYQLSYTSYPEKALDDNVYWSVDDTEAAQIDSDGLLTIKKPGEFRVTAVLVSDSRIFCRREIKVVK